MKKKLISTFKLTITLILFYLIFSKIELNRLLSLFSQTRSIYLFASFLLMYGVTLVLGYRLSLVTKTPFRLFPSLMLKVYFFNNLLPAQIGGDIYKYIALNRFHTSKSYTFSAIFSDRLLGITGLLVMSFCNLLVFSSYFNDHRIYYGFFFYLIILIVILSVIFFIPNFNLSRIKNKYLLNGLKFIYKTKTDAKQFYLKNLMSGLLLTIIGYFILVLVNVFAMKALQLKVDFWASLIYVPVISVAVITFPISFNGLGVRESLFVLFFGMVGYTMEECIAMAFINLISIWVVSLFGGVLILISKERITEIKNFTTNT